MYVNYFNQQDCCEHTQTRPHGRPNYPSSSATPPLTWVAWGSKRTRPGSNLLSTPGEAPGVPGLLVSPSRMESRSASSSLLELGGGEPFKRDIALPFKTVSGNTQLMILRHDFLDAVSFTNVCSQRCSPKTRFFLDTNTILR